MGAEKATVEQLRSALARYRQQQKHGKYPDRLRQQACRYTRARQGDGVSVSAIAQELGVPKATAARWTTEAENSKPVQPQARSSVEGVSFMPVVVRPVRPEWPAARLEVDFADGTRLQAFGVGPEALASTLQTLRRQG